MYASPANSLSRLARSIIVSSTVTLVWSRLGYSTQTIAPRSSTKICRIGPCHCHHKWRSPAAETIQQFLALERKGNTQKATDFPSI
ncbi:hypothetical protein C8Q74DRAFT_1248368 [Fomes fomentarius]|nr:hypothetical protein C8Q74DRAFT_1248368 [Fomes fomentarius]